MLTLGLVLTFLCGAVIGIIVYFDKSEPLYAHIVLGCILTMFVGMFLCIFGLLYTNGRFHPETKEMLATAAVLFLIALFFIYG